MQRPITIPLTLEKYIVQLATSSVFELCKGDDWNYFCCAMAKDYYGFIEFINRVSNVLFDQEKLICLFFKYPNFKEDVLKFSSVLLCIKKYLETETVDNYWMVKFTTNSTIGRFKDALAIAIWNNSFSIKTGEKDFGFPLNEGFSFPCVYFFHHKTTLFYVGQTTNFAQRMKQHHRLPELVQLQERFGVTVQVSYIIYEESDLEEKERFFIETLKPKLNNTPVSKFNNTPVSSFVS